MLGVSISTSASVPLKTLRSTRPVATWIWIFARVRYAILACVRWSSRSTLA
jgi:hypothetical protein